MKKWIVAILVGGLIAGSATMAFADETVVVGEKKLDLGRTRIGRTKTEKGKPGQTAERLEQLFEDYLPGEMDAFESKLEEGKEGRDKIKALREELRENHEEAFEASRVDGKALAREWREKVKSGQATREEAGQAMKEWKQDIFDEILGVDGTMRASLNSIHEQLKAEREEGKEIREELKAAITASNEDAIAELLEDILDEMDTRTDLHEQRYELFLSL
jgi:gas vesicle protein